MPGKDHVKCIPTDIISQLLYIEQTFLNGQLKIIFISTNAFNDAEL